jgi:type IV pilus assembly protein PilM
MAFGKKRRSSDKEKIDPQPTPFDFGVELDEEAQAEIDAPAKDDQDIPETPPKPPSEWSEDAFLLGEKELESESSIVFDIEDASPEGIVEIDHGRRFETPEPSPDGDKPLPVEGEMPQFERSAPSETPHMEIDLTPQEAELVYQEEAAEDAPPQPSKEDLAPPQSDAIAMTPPQPDATPPQPDLTPPQPEQKQPSKEDSDKQAEPSKKKEETAKKPGLLERLQIWFKDKKAKDDLLKAERRRKKAAKKSKKDGEAPEPLTQLALPEAKTSDAAPQPAPPQPAPPQPAPPQPAPPQPAPQPELSKEEQKAFKRREKERQAEEKRRQDEEKRRQKEQNKDTSKLEKKRAQSRKRQQERLEKARKKEEKRRQAETEKEEKRLAKIAKKAEKERAKDAKHGMLPEKKDKSDPGRNLEKIPFFGKSLAEKSRAKALEQEKEAESTKSDPGRDGRLKKRKQARARKKTRNVIGLDIGASELRAVLMRDDYPVSLSTYPLPEGVIVDGMLLEPEVLSDALKKFWQIAGFKSKTVNFSITNRLVTLRTINIAAEHEEDVEQAVTMMSGSLIEPMDPEETIIDYAELSRSGPNISIQLAAADEEMIKDFTKAVERAGLLSASCEIGPLAMSRAFRIPRSPSATHALIDIGAETTSFVAASGPDVFYLRVVEIGGNDFTRAIMKKLNCSFTEAEALKLASGLDSEPVDPSIEHDRFTQAQEAMLGVADRLHQALIQTKSAYENEGRPINGHTLIGGGSKLKGLDQQIQLYTGLTNLTKLEPWPGLEEAEDVELNASALGLARGHMMSLLPEIDVKSFNVSLPGRRSRSKISMEKSKKQAKRLTQKRKKQQTSPKIIALLVAAVALAGGFMANKQLTAANDELRPQVEKEERTARNRSRQVQAPTYQAPGQTGRALATIANQLVIRPDYQALKQVGQILTQNQVQDVRIKTVEDTVEISGLTSSTDQPDEIAAEIKEKNISQEVSSELGATRGGSQVFKLEVVLPPSLGGINNG